MTMPVERMRALRWGHELLSAIQGDVTLPESVRARANGLSDHYPSARSLHDLLTVRARALPAAWADSIEAAGHLFEELQFSGAGTTETRRHLLYTRRHFPSRGAAQAVARPGQLGTLSDWIAPEEGQSP